MVDEVVKSAVRILADGTIARGVDGEEAGGTAGHRAALAVNEGSEDGLFDECVELCVIFMQPLWKNDAWTQRMWLMR